MNKALLTKAGQRMVNSMHNQCNIVRAQYLQGELFHHALWTEALPQGSKIWNNMMHTQKILKMGCHWIVGNGDTIDFWEDQWLQDYPFKHTKFISLHEIYTRANRSITQNYIMSEPQWNGIQHQVGLVLLQNFKAYCKIIGSPSSQLRTHWFGSLLPCG